MQKTSGARNASLRIQTRTTQSLLQDFKLGVADFLQLLASRRPIDADRDAVRTRLHHCIATACELLYVTLPPSTRVSSLAVAALKDHVKHLLESYKHLQLGQGIDAHTDFVLSVTGLAETVCDIIDSYIHRDEIMTACEREMQVLSVTMQENKKLENDTKAVLHELNIMVAEDQQWRETRRQQLAAKEKVLLNKYTVQQLAVAYSVVDESPSATQIYTNGTPTSAVTTSKSQRASVISSNPQLSRRLSGAYPVHSQIPWSTINPERYTLASSRNLSPLSASMFSEVSGNTLLRGSIADSIKSDARDNNTINPNGMTRTTNKRYSHTPLSAHSKSLAAASTQESIKLLGSQIDDLRQQFNLLDRRVSTGSPRISSPMHRHFTTVRQNESFPEIQFASPVSISIGDKQFTVQQQPKSSKNDETSPFSANDFISSYRILSVKPEFPPTSSHSPVSIATTTAAIPVADNVDDEITPSSPLLNNDDNSSDDKLNDDTTNHKTYHLAQSFNHHQLKAATTNGNLQAHRTPRIASKQYISAHNNGNIHDKRNLHKSMNSVSGAGEKIRIMLKHKSNIHTPYENESPLDNEKTWQHHWIVMRVDLRGKCDQFCAICEATIGLIDKKVFCRDCGLTCHFICQRSIGGAEKIECSVFTNTKEIQPRVRSISRTSRSVAL